MLLESCADAVPPSGSDPELEADPELEPDPVLLELPDPVVELLDPDPADDDPPLLPVPLSPVAPSSPRSLGCPPLLPHPGDARTSPANKRRSDPQALDR